MDSKRVVLCWFFLVGTLAGATEAGAATTPAAKCRHALAVGLRRLENRLLGSVTTCHLRRMAAQSGYPASAFCADSAASLSGVRLVTALTILDLHSLGGDTAATVEVECQ